MPRNYKKETEWSNAKYDVLRVRLEKETGEKFREKLKKDGITISEWMRENVESYLKENHKN